MVDLRIGFINDYSSKADPFKNGISGDFDRLGNVVGIVENLALNRNLFGYVFVVEELQPHYERLNFSL